MEEYIQKLNAQLEKLKYLDGTRNKNLQIIENRLREINKQKIRNRNVG